MHLKKERLTLMTDSLIGFAAGAWFMLVCATIFIVICVGYQKIKQSSAAAVERETAAALSTEEGAQ